MDTPKKKRRPGGSWPKAAFHIPDEENRCVREVRPKTEFDPRGFRYKVVGKVPNGSTLYGIVGCPTGQWVPDRDRGTECIVPLRMHIAITDRQGKESCDVLTNDDFDQALESVQARRESINNEFDREMDVDPDNVDYGDGALDGAPKAKGRRKKTRTKVASAASDASNTKSRKRVKKVSRARR
jgi:hypothetical protein